MTFSRVDIAYVDLHKSLNDIFRIIKNICSLTASSRNISKPSPRSAAGRATAPVPGVAAPPLLPLHASARLSGTTGARPHQPLPGRAVRAPASLAQRCVVSAARSVLLIRGISLP